MNDERRKKLSKTLSYHLRHAPSEIGLTLQEGGYVFVDELLDALENRKGVRINPTELDYIVTKCEKQRFAYSEDGERIRANQGHSVKVDLQLEETEPPDVLYHGTATRHQFSIIESGLKKMNRHHVHLSSDKATALNVGKRHGKPVIFKVDAAAMKEDGYKFYRSENGVWLTDKVPPAYISLCSE